MVDMTFIAFLLIIDLFDTVASMEQSDLYVSRLHLDDLDHIIIRKLCQLNFIATGFSLFERLDCVILAFTDGEETTACLELLARTTPWITWTQEVF